MTNYSDDIFLLGIKVFLIKTINNIFVFHSTSTDSEPANDV